MRIGKMRKVGIALALSLASHATPAATYNEISELKRYAGQQIEKILRGSGCRRYTGLQAERARLLERAQHQLDRGRLQLGEFLIESESIDARERGEVLDTDGAISRYHRDLERVRELMRSGRSIQAAIPQVLSDVRYSGLSDGRLTSVVLTRFGLCTNLSRYEAALAYDSGRRDVFFREFCPNSRGNGHITAVIIVDGLPYDFTTGNWAAPGREQYRSDRAPQLYAIMHGIPFGHRIPRSAHEQAPEECNGRRTVPGGAPAFSLGPAVNPPQTTEEARQVATGETEVEDELVFNYSEWYEFRFEDIIAERRRVTISLPSAPGLVGDPQEEGIFFVGTHCDERDEKEIEEERTDAEHNLARISRTIDDVEVLLQNETRTGARLVLMGYLVKLYQSFEEELRSPESPDMPLGIRERIRENRERIVREAHELIANTDMDDRQVRHDIGEGMGQVDGDSSRRAQPWYIIFLGEPGEDFLMSIFESRYSYNAISSDQRILMALLTDPETQERALPRLQQWNKLELIDMIRHYVNDNKGGVYDIEEGIQRRAFITEGFGDFYKAYNAYMNIIHEYEPALRYIGMVSTVSGPGSVLQSGIEHPDFNELQEHVRREIREQGLSEEWEIAFMVHFSESSMLCSGYGGAVLCDHNGDIVRNQDDVVQYTNEEGRIQNSFWLDGIGFRNVSDAIQESNEERVLRNPANMRGGEDRYMGTVESLNAGSDVRREEVIVSEHDDGDPGVGQDMNRPDGGVSDGSYDADIDISDADRVDDDADVETDAGNAETINDSEAEDEIRSYREISLDERTNNTGFVRRYEQWLRGIDLVGTGIAEPANEGSIRGRPREWFERLRMN